MGWSCWRYPIISSFGPCQEISSVLKCSRKPSCTQYCCLQASVLAVDHGVGHTPAQIHGMMCPETPESMDLGVCTLESPLLAPSDAPKPLESGSTPPKGVSKGVPLLEDPILGTLRCSKTPRIGINSPKRGPQKEWFQTPKSSVWTQTPCAS